MHVVHSGNFRFGSGFRAFGLSYHDFVGGVCVGICQKEAYQHTFTYMLPDSVMNWNMTWLYSSIKAAFIGVLHNKDMPCNMFLVICAWRPTLLKYHDMNVIFSFSYWIFQAWGKEFVAINKVLILGWILILHESLCIAFKVCVWRQACLPSSLPTVGIDYLWESKQQSDKPNQTCSQQGTQVHHYIHRSRSLWTFDPIIESTYEIKIWVFKFQHSTMWFNDCRPTLWPIPSFKIQYRGL